MVVSKISSSFNLAIPREIRLALNLQPGDAFEFYVQEDGSIVLKKEASHEAGSNQIALPAFEWVYEDEDEDDEEDCSPNLIVPIEAQKGCLQI